MLGSEALHVLRSCARPVIFETGLKEASFSTIGTCFLLGYRASVYVITAQHVVREWPLDGLHIRPSDLATWRLPLVHGYTLPVREEDRDLADLAIIKADLRSVRGRDRRSSNLIRVPEPPSDWFPHRASSTFFCFGFPVGPIVVDYDLSSVSTMQYMLTGTYRGPSVDFGVYEIEAKNPLQLEDFNGMSGSPVFSLMSTLEPSQPILAGMLLRGSARSGRVHFLGFERIFSALVAIERGQFV